MRSIIGPIVKYPRSVFGNIVIVIRIRGIGPPAMIADENGYWLKFVA